VERKLKGELPASQPMSDGLPPLSWISVSTEPGEVHGDPGAVEVADGRIAMMRRRSVRPLLVIQPGGRRFRKQASIGFPPAGEQRWYACGGGGRVTPRAAALGSALS